MTKRTADRTIEFAPIVPRPILKGPEVWLSLPESLLSREAKALLNCDPNLTRETMAQLLKVQPITKDVEFYFGLDDRDDIGITVLSMCINEDLSQSMAELVARYAATRKIPFTETAIGVLKLYYCQGETFVRYKEAESGIIREAWSPHEVPVVVKPPAKKRREEGH